MPTRILAALTTLLATAGISHAATPKEIDAAVERGTAFLKKEFGGPKLDRNDDGEGIGPAALAGLALLECAVPADDPAVRAVAAAVRDAAFTEVRTYQITLCILFLDRLADPADVPLIQMLGVRLAAGQNAAGGWTYRCIDSVPAADERALRAALMVTELKAGAKPPAPVVKPADPQRPLPVVGRLHADVERYAGKLAAERARRRDEDDNSNTQFGILGVWAARRHGVPVEPNLEAIEKRFLATQTASGGWPYSGHAQGSPSMTCAGLLGLATAVGRREERRMKAEGPRLPAAKPPAKSDDPFFNPPQPEPPKAKAGPKPPPDARDAAIAKGLVALAAALAGDPGPAKGKGGKNRVLAGGALGDRDFYFLWSLERVGVVFGLEKVGNTDWYALGADELVAAQHAGGGWGKGARGGVVDTSFALLFLKRSNLVRDLTARVQQGTATTEMRAGKFPTETKPEPAPPPTPKTPVAIVPTPTVISPKPTPVPLPVPAPAVAPDVKALAADLIGASDAAWEKALEAVRDGKGVSYTHALLAAAGKLDGERKKAVRDALAERLTRMTAPTLRTMATDTDAELRRAAVLAMAMKDDKQHLPDLVAALADDEPAVVRAARAGLKAVTGEDFGPAPDATPAERTAAIRAWGEWLKKQK